MCGSRRRRPMCHPSCVLVLGRGSPLRRWACTARSPDTGRGDNAERFCTTRRSPRRADRARAPSGTRWWWWRRSLRRRRLWLCRAWQPLRGRRSPGERPVALTRHKSLFKFRLLVRHPRAVPKRESRREPHRSPRPLARGPRSRHAEWHAREPKHQPSRMAGLAHSLVPTPTALR
jgi:hypothetical protein